ncbi:MAG: hypothetical protein NTX18_01625 [Cyanobium sp. LacPavin_0818_WC50_MAG_67_9]|nr:hypothetical protein [Cyanobium sp. LacPavin_0818_WC50_MAG_67_9]
MAQRHWLDPLARQVLRATGQIPAPSRQPPQPSCGEAPDEERHREHVERDLLALKLQQDPNLRLEDAAAVERAAALGWRLDVNRATAADWLRLPGLEPAQVDLLLRLQAGGVQLSGSDDLQRVLELPGRGPFLDLADLQQRLQLPAALVESWIGRVQFRPGPAGPVLPPSARDR